jgi:hypothetical protein
MAANDARDRAELLTVLLGDYMKFEWPPAVSIAMSRLKLALVDHLAQISTGEQSVTSPAYDEGSSSQ